MKKFQVVWYEEDGTKHDEEFQLDTDGTESMDELGDRCHRVLQKTGEWADEIVSIVEV